MDGDAVLGVESCGGVAGNNRKAEKMAVPRKRLADISNVPQQPKSATLDAKKQSISFDTKQYIDKLQMEKVALIKVLADRNKIIELSGIELQKLRINLQKVQQQNLQLAKTNTQMFAELNSGKDRLKALQHELGCKNGLLNARKLEMEKAKIVKRQTYGNKVETIKYNEAWDSSQADKGEDKPCGTKKRRPSKVQSLGNPTVKMVEAKDKVDDKRRSSRRQSARFKSEGEPSEDVLEVDDTKFPVATLGNGSVVETGPASVSVSDKDEPDANSLSPENEAQDFGWSSIERPTCQAAKKVHSCKEASLKVEAKDKVDIKRRSSRRQSARFKSQGETSEDVFEIDETKFHVSTLGDDLVLENGPTSVSVAAKDEDNANDPSTEGDAQEFCGRPSIGRPSRQAAKNVHSYKEISRKVKMRRTE
ncbi:shugoshin-1-like isoform X1 [Tripterygium wilfordii]|uniref:Shugoshin-1-like isoform X1 n=1 Tax=Tripterygium wilfordii TaxID=458696 RepID=A0A7J7D8A2_TRIWF|nr:SHUGOSHIN 2-like [Tripterygium wilfordii]KAF5742595.1 shugoshin-1-like isoform X1 [Tripterygium wilfordii]